MHRGPRGVKKLAFLAAALSHPDELLADFQETYRIDLWGVCWDAVGDDTAAHMAALAFQLPKGGRVWRSIAPAQSHSTEARLLRQLEINQRNLAWSLGGGKGKDPEPIWLDGEEEAHEEAVRAEERKSVRVADGLGIEI